MPIELRQLIAVPRGHQPAALPSPSLFSPAEGGPECI